MIDTEKLTWRDLSLLEKAPADVRLWLSDEHSLTAKLKAKFSDFSVRVLSQKTTNPHQNEANIISQTQPCMVREVALLGGGEVVVFARSIIPINADTQPILDIGNQPLGEILFNHPNIKRSLMQITHVENIWGRRSIFTLGGSKLLVSEFFMRTLYAPR
jgi:chorismate--pyruvate lyase